MAIPEKSELIAKMKSGELIPYLGAGALEGVKNVADGTSIPADSESLILAMTGGTPMAPRLMYEFPRAAMHLENKKGRSFLERFLKKTYAETDWSDAALHTWLHSVETPFIIDSNRDLKMQTLLKDRAHNLIVGAARLAAHPHRFDIYEWVDGKYQLRPQDLVNTALPTLFKPLGSPEPKPSFVASDADFVDYITELMGGFAIPAWIKEKRINKQYLFLGMRFTRDTERMVMSDMIYGASEDCAGWALIPEPTDKEKRFLTKKNVVIIEQDWTSFLKNEVLQAA
ncbi:SIR2 family protein [Sessilibacter corallicola]|uniref:SIR2 family protein n=1 Tax=Sessilibacter corallicola TaxID=2904075 RepID=UPI001E457B4E|nr:SIR2 family protein [Sessilibacter corallicola]